MKNNDFKFGLLFISIIQIGVTLILIMEYLLSLIKNIPIPFTRYLIVEIIALFVGLFATFVLLPIINKFLKQ